LVRCSHGYPQVLRVRPLIDGKPFPTLYWLSCPHLVGDVDRLEADDWIDRLERRMSDDPWLQAVMNEAHRRYIWQRLTTLMA